MGMISKQIEELRKYARKWSEWNGFNAAMPVSPCTNVRLLRSAADTIETLNRPTGKWIVDIFDYKSVCSVCGAKETNFIYGTEMWYGLGESKFCPNCGAKMSNNDNE